MTCAKSGCDYERDDGVHRPMSECPDRGLRQTRSGEIVGRRTRKDLCPWPDEHHDYATGKPFEGAK